ncbi:MAG: hypothetical protein FWC23_04330 [Chitinispirillia bacterium]|nr:hypothetical protein [Chitinispirillia bacterium]MCL2268393.1 hypothetical protein [Chitinispirillia bacterium]
MDTAAILIKITGLILFAFTVRSVYRHLRAKLAKNRAPAPAPASSPPKADGKPEQSKVEHALNAFLLYAWFIFMTALSLGMVFNN